MGCSGGGVKIEGGVKLSILYGSRIHFSRKLKREHCFCTEMLSQIDIWYKKDDVTKKNRLSHVTSCLEIVTKKVCLFSIQILDRKHESEHKKLDLVHNGEVISLRTTIAQLRPLNHQGLRKNSKTSMSAGKGGRQLVTQ